ncbi:MAG: hypothetical protein NT131_07900 [Methanomassiliicoccales archaeon]|nr:hypothetical protein [Methanomassiliicoccales archaeon]
MRDWRNNDEGVGGFLESILAVMAVITASSIFLVMLSVSAVQEGPTVDGDELIDLLREQGLWPDDGEAIELDLLEQRFASLPALPEGFSGVCLKYRPMGEAEALLSLGGTPPSGAAVLSARAPLLLSVDGRAIPATVEVQAW